MNHELDTISEILSAENQQNQIDQGWMHRSIHTCSDSICTHATTQELNFGVLAPISENLDREIDGEMQQQRLHDWLRQEDSFAKSLPSFNSTASSIEPKHISSPAQSAKSVSTASTRSLPITNEHYQMIRSCHNAACGHFGRDETIRKLQRAIT